MCLSGSSSGEELELGNFILKGQAKRDNMGHKIGAKRLVKIRSKKWYRIVAIIRVKKWDEIKVKKSVRIVGD